MDKKLREAFNQKFSKEHYEKHLSRFQSIASKTPGFRIAETPVFINKELKNRLLEAGDEIIELISSKEFKQFTDKSIPQLLTVPNEDDHPQMMVVDFGICKDDNGNIVPKLIELQGFPSLFAFQCLSDQLTRQYTSIPDNYDSYLNGYNSESYIELLKELLLEQHSIENVILLEWHPEQQKTAIDFVCTEKLLGIKTVCLTELIVDDNKLFYLNEGKKTKVEIIFNRVIFEEIKEELSKIKFDLNKAYDVKWIPHPNWYYRISKYTLPFLSGKYIPKSFFLHEIKQPLPLEKYVLKPLFSYAGTGVLIDVTSDDIDNITDPENWILQEKVNYEPVVSTPEGDVKTEIRLFYFWKKEWKKPLAIHNLARMNKGNMIGTRFNNNDNWVGGTIAYFEKD